MKTKRFDEILTQFWPEYLVIKGIANINRPTLLTMFAEHCFKYNLQGLAIDEVREFMKAFYCGKEQFEKELNGR